LILCQKIINDNENNKNDFSIYKMINTYNLTSKGNGDIFISKLDAAGTFIWANRTFIWGDGSIM